MHAFIYTFYSNALRRSALSLLFCSLLLMCCSCSERTFHYDLYGADEFVLDSYIIGQGKLAILEMEGKDAGICPDMSLCEYEDDIMDGDLLTIYVYHPARHDIVDSVAKISEKAGFQVQRGCIQLPSLPPIEVRGLTLLDAQERLRCAFESPHSDVNVFLSYRDRLTRKVELAGQVSVPYVAINGKTRLYDVLAQARIPPQANLFMSYILRDGQPIAIDLHKLIHGGDLSQNIVMRGGDKIFIADHSESRVMVMGEVTHPRAINLPHGSVSLREALVEAGGIPYTGNRNCIQVIRGNLISPKIYTLSWQHITHLPNDSLLLMPGDTVYITETPLTRWNRFISQLVPSLNIFQQCNSCYGLF